MKEQSLRQDGGRKQSVTAWRVGPGAPAGMRLTEQGEGGLEQKDTVNQHLKLDPVPTMSE